MAYKNKDGQKCYRQTEKGRLAYRKGNKKYAQSEKGKLTAKKYYKNHRKEKQLIRQILMHKLKINGCAICGYDKCVAALHFHHVNPSDKNFCLCVHTMYYSNDRIVNEINKCILLCANCHAEIEHIEGK